MALTCLETLVGLSDTEYACFSDAAPDGFDTSASGYFLTDTDYGLTVIEQCSMQGWTLLTAALEQAVREFKTDLRAKLRTEYDPALTPFRGQVGKLDFTGTNTVSKDFIGLRIRPQWIKGAKLVLNGIYLGLNTEATYAVNIRSNDPTFSWAGSLNVDTTGKAGAFTTKQLFSTPVELPFWSENCPSEYLEYYVTIERDGATPLNNKLTCCNKVAAYTKHIDVHGMLSADADGTGGTFSTWAYGMVLDAYLTCEELDWICELEELNGYSVLDVCARTIQFRGAALAISGLLDTLTVSPCTAYNAEALNAKRNYLNKRYSDNLEWLTQNVPAGATNCFVCKPERQFKHAKMLV
jgi:hypothetical protein